jgi:peroxiredoxin Q/BCP
MAPDFRLAATDGRSVALSEYRGRKLVLYFYPKADTPGCTQESVEFNRLRKDFAKADTALLGISADPVRAQDRFRAKYSLDFPLASDPTHEALNAYGVWGKKRMFGRSYMGIIRCTFLIDARGRIAQVWPKVTVAGHARDVLAAARAL